MLGWSSWNRLKNDINESVIKEMANAMVSTGLRDVGYRFINVDGM
jgi:alpha-galactosidase